MSRVHITMKSLAVGMAVLAGGILAAAELPPYFTGDLEAVLDKAAREKKVLLVSAGREICGRCQKFYGFVKSDEVLIDTNLFTFVRLDVDDGMYREYVWEMLQPANGNLPFVGVVRPDKTQVVPTLCGQTTAEAYRDMLKKAAARVKPAAAKPETAKER